MKRMDESQSSDFFADSIDVSANSPSNYEDNQYDLFLSNTKSALSSNILEEMDDASFSKLLDDSDNCINQSLDLVTEMLEKNNINLQELIEYINNAVSLLQMLSNFLKKIIESIPVSCSNMESLPTTTGRIIMTVFSHCKNSESLYGEHLASVGNNLKDLFRTCHELQLTYLIILEKHFEFDLLVNRQQDILIEALDINLRIGELVQTLDVKTMAEQWKAYTVICEKYSYFLVDKDVYCKSIEKLCEMVEENIKNAAKAKQDEKLMLRSLKVASFMIKIVHKIHVVNAPVNNYKRIVVILLNINMYHRAYLDLIGEKSPMLSKLLDDNVIHPSESLLKELLLDETFARILLTYDTDEVKQDDSMLAYILLVMTVMRITIQTSNATSRVHELKNNIIICIYKLLPHCHVWFNVGLKLRHKIEPDIEPTTLGLYESLLSHAFALALTMDSKEFNALEKILIEGILCSELYVALFSSNLSVCLARVTHRELSLSKVLILIKIYKTMEKKEQFFKSPQHIHLSYTISETFNLLDPDDKIKIYEKYSIDDDTNLNLWTALRISNLPQTVQIRTSDLVNKKFSENLTNISSKSYESANFERLIRTMKLLATSSNLSGTCLQSNVIKAWRKACLEGKMNIAELSKSILWYYEYVETLVSLTRSAESVLQDKSANVITILHVVSNIVQSGNTELTLLIVNILCKLAAREVEDKETYGSDIIFTRTFKHFLQESNVMLKYYFFYTLRKYKHERNIIRTVNKIVNENNTLKDEWRCFMKSGCLKYNIVVRKNVSMTQDFYYCHKCLKYEQEIANGVLSTQKTSDNFDLVDMDTLFEEDSNTEPVSKKVKLTDGIEALISKLESVAQLVCDHKDNVFTSEHKSRLIIVSDKLRSVLNKY